MSDTDYYVVRQLFSLDNPDGIFKKDSFIYDNIINTVKGFLILSLIISIYFLFIGMGLLTSLTVWHQYDIRSGCNSNCTAHTMCHLGDSYTIFLWCLLPGILSTVIIVTVIIVSVTLFIRMVEIYRICQQEIEQSYERTKRRYEYDEVGAAL